jgi:hypothetical protein
MPHVGLRVQRAAVITRQLRPAGPDPVPLLLERLTVPGDLGLRPRGSLAAGGEEHGDANLRGIRVSARRAAGRRSGVRSRRTGDRARGERVAGIGGRAAARPRPERKTVGQRPEANTNLSGAARAAGTYREDITYSNGNSTCTSLNQSWSATH